MRIDSALSTEITIKEDNSLYVACSLCLSLPVSTLELLIRQLIFTSKVLTECVHRNCGTLLRIPHNNNQTPQLSQTQTSFNYVDSMSMAHRMRLLQYYGCMRPSNKRTSEWFLAVAFYLILQL